MALLERLIRMVMPKMLPRPSVDAEIEVALAAQDKRHVLTLLMTRFGEPIYRYAVAMTRDRHMAEEVRQQVFVEAYRDLEHVADASALPTWIFGIARHRCFDAVDAQLRWNERYKNAPPAEMQVDDCEPGRDLDRRQLTRILDVCLAKLAPAAREAVLLRYRQELSYDQVAVITGDLPSTVRRRVSRALPMLRRCLEAMLQPEESR